MGVSIDGDPRVSYVIIELRNRANPCASFVRFRDDYSNVASDAKRRNVPGVTTEQFLRGI